ncbi:hypothetical protein ACFQX7_25515 [Luedemannella flava]
METAAPAPAWWSTLPAHRVAHLTGVDPDLLAIALDPLPAGAPAVLRFRPSATGPLGDQVAVLLAELDRVAVALFPAWLPGADRLAGPQGRGWPRSARWPRTSPPARPTSARSSPTWRSGRSAAGRVVGPGFPPRYGRQGSSGRSPAPTTARPRRC